MYKSKITKEDLLNFEAIYRALIATDGKKSIYAIPTTEKSLLKYIVINNGIESSYLTIESAVNAYNGG